MNLTVSTFLLACNRYLHRELPSLNVQDWCLIEIVRKLLSS